MNEKHMNENENTYAYKGLNPDDQFQKEWHDLRAKHKGEYEIVECAREEDVARWVPDLKWASQAGIACVVGRNGVDQLINHVMPLVFPEFIGDVLDAEHHISAGELVAPRGTEIAVNSMATFSSRNLGQGEDPADHGLDGNYAVAGYRDIGDRCPAGWVMNPLPESINDFCVYQAQRHLSKEVLDAVGEFSGSLKFAVAMMCMVSRNDDAFWPKCAGAQYVETIVTARIESARHTKDAGSQANALRETIPLLAVLWMSHPGTMSRLTTIISMISGSPDVDGDTLMAMRRQFLEYRKALLKDDLSDIRPEIAQFRQVALRVVRKYLTRAHAIDHAVWHNPTYRQFANDYLRDIAGRYIVKDGERWTPKDSGFAALLSGYPVTHAVDSSEGFALGARDIIVPALKRAYSKHKKELERTLGAEALLPLVFEANEEEGDVRDTLARKLGIATREEFVNMGEMEQSLEIGKMLDAMNQEIGGQKTVDKMIDKCSGTPDDHVDAVARHEFCEACCKALNDGTYLDPSEDIFIRSACAIALSSAKHGWVQSLTPPVMAVMKKLSIMDSPRLTDYEIGCLVRVYQAWKYPKDEELQALAPEHQVLTGLMVCALLRYAFGDTVALQTINDALGADGPNEK